MGHVASKRKRAGYTKFSSKTRRVDVTSYLTI